jgi:hypothetical protein
MLLYIAANSKAVSVAVMVERKEEGMEYPVQRPVYYISEVLAESKQRYPHWQKLVYGVFMATRKLKHYFQEHLITVVSSAPLGDIIQNREATAGLPSGLLSLARIISNMCLALQSSHKPWWISSMTGLSYRLRRRSQIQHIGPSTLTAHGSWKVQGLGLW